MCNPALEKGVAGLSKKSLNAVCHYAGLYKFLENELNIKKGKPQQIAS